MADTQAIVAAIYTALTTDQTAGSFYDDVSGRIYEGQAHQNDTLPHCVYNVIVASQNLTHDTTDYDWLLQVDFYADAESSSMAALSAIENKAFDLLEKGAFSATGFDAVQVLCVTRGMRTIEEDAFRIMDEFRVQATVPA